MTNKKKEGSGENPEGDYPYGKNAVGCAMREIERDGIDISDDPVEVPKEISSLTIEDIWNRIEGISEMKKDIWELLYARVYQIEADNPHLIQKTRELKRAMRNIKR